MNIVIDTNVLISGLFFGGYPRDIINASNNGLFNVVASPQIITEYDRVTKEMDERKKGILDFDAFHSFINTIIIVFPLIEVNVSRDSKDDMFIECALDSGASYIVTGDEDLLVLKQVNDVKIIKPKDFCEIFL